ncbi:MAG TPA: DUF2752 domain-containing protein [Verrucomicrobium sp.]|nr:DUF2752 domain-containing protein [Verrucomicrobium sp.]
MRAAHRYTLFSALMVLALVGAVVLYQNPPASSSFYPPCVFHRVTGWHCSGCGATRCVHALLHLDLIGAAQKNLLALVGLPFLGFAMLRSLWRWTLGKPRSAATKAPSPAIAIAIVVAIIGFGILRNLPWAPFSWLAPH